MSSRTKGVVFIISAAFCFALMGLFVRLSGDLPFIQKSLFRNLVALFVISFNMLRMHEKIVIKKGDLKFLMMRALFGSVGIFGNFYAIDHLVLSDATMLNKLSPFFVIIFSFIILKEKLTLVQGASVVIAFIGALFIIKPTGDVANFAAIAGALGGMGAGAAYTMVRILGQRGVKSNVVILFFSAVSCLLCVPFIIGHFEPMSFRQITMLLGAGIAATGGQVFITKAYFYAPAKEISVYDYSQIIFSALIGFVVLGQVPDRYSVIGYVIICATAVVMFIYNNAEEKKTAAGKKCK